MSAIAPPAARQAPSDLRIRGAPLAVYYHVLQEGLLGFVEFTELKSSAVERGVKINERTARWAVRRLVECGYLEEGERAHPTAPGRYRLRWASSAAGSGSPLPNSSRVDVVARVV